MLVGEHKPGIGGDKLLGQKPKPQYSKIPPGQGNAGPAWVAFDRQVIITPVISQDFIPDFRIYYKSPFASKLS